MKKKTILWKFFLLLTLILGACAPTTFSPPTEIHITAGDDVEHAVIAVDTAGRSHIAGVVNDRIVYYRTLFGEPLVKFTLALGGTGANWKQYNPDITVVNGLGGAYLTWVEQRGSVDKYACYLQIPINPPIIGDWDKSCHALDSSNHTTGNVWVTARGSKVYAVYDRAYTDKVRTAELWYKVISSTPAYAGRIDWFTERFETASIYSLDLGIDSAGFLHVGYHYNWTTGGPPPYSERLELRSNCSTLADGQMDQIWVILDGNAVDEDIPVSLTFYDEGTTQLVALAHTNEPTDLNKIYVETCNADGCAAGTRYFRPVDPPGDWDTFSVIDDVEIQGIGEEVFLGFIGDDNTAPTGVEQVYFTNAFDTALFYDPSDGSATYKYDLEITALDTRPGATGGTRAVISWAESGLLTTTYFAHGFLAPVVKFSENNCLDSLASVNIDSNGMYLAGVWDACGDTWFTTQAWTEQLPLILK